MRVVSIVEASDRLESILDGVSSHADCAVVTRPDAEDAVVMSLDYYNSLMETVHLLKSPAVASRVISYRISRIVSGRLAPDLSHCPVIVGEPGERGSLGGGYDGATAIAMITAFVVRKDWPARAVGERARQVIQNCTSSWSKSSSCPSWAERSSSRRSS